MGSIETAKKELWEILKGYNGIEGAGIKERGAKSYIVIYTTNAALAHALVPATFSGFDVEVEDRSKIQAK